MTQQYLAIVSYVIYQKTNKAQKVLDELIAMIIIV